MANCPQEQFWNKWRPPLMFRRLPSVIDPLDELLGDPKGFGDLANPPPVLYSPKYQVK